MTPYHSTLYRAFGQGVLDRIKHARLCCRNGGTVPWGWVAYGGMLGEWLWTLLSHGQLDIDKSWFCKQV